MVLNPITESQETEPYQLFMIRDEELLVIYDYKPYTCFNIIKEFIP